MHKSPKVLYIKISLSGENCTKVFHENIEEADYHIVGRCTSVFLFIL